MPCDTKNSKSDQCNRCFLEWLRGDDEGDEELWLYPCVAEGCGVRHLRRNMIDKLEGHYCESCAKEYEEKLLEMMNGKRQETPELHPSRT